MWLAADSASKCLLIQRPPPVQLLYIKAHVYFFSRDNGYWIKAKQCRKIRFHRAQCGCLFLYNSVLWTLSWHYLAVCKLVGLIWSDKVKSAGFLHTLTVSFSRSKRSGFPGPWTPSPTIPRWSFLSIWRGRSSWKGDKRPNTSWALVYTDSLLCRRLALLHFSIISQKLKVINLSTILYCFPIRLWVISANHYKSFSALVRQEQPVLPDFLGAFLSITHHTVKKCQLSYGEGMIGARKEGWT